MRKIILSFLYSSVLSLFIGCNGAFYQPTRTVFSPPPKLHIDYQDLYFYSLDGILLNGWFLPGKAPVKGTVILFHGNGANIGNHLGTVYWLPGEGYNVFLFDYRGYGNSEGRPTRKGIQKDAIAALNFIRKKPEVNPDKLVVFGQSLGGAIAASAVAASPQPGIRLVILESSLSSYRKITREKLGHFLLTWPLQWPLSFLVSDDMSPIDVISKISPIPILIIHGDADPIVPSRHSIDLFNAAREPKSLWTIKGGYHIDAFSPAHPEYREKLLNVMNQILGAVS